VAQVTQQPPHQPPQNPVIGQRVQPVQITQRPGHDRARAEHPHQIQLGHIGVHPIIGRRQAVTLVGQPGRDPQPLRRRQHLVEHLERRAFVLGEPVEHGLVDVADALEVHHGALVGLGGGNECGQPVVVDGVGDVHSAHQRDDAAVLGAGPGVRSGLKAATARPHRRGHGLFAAAAQGSGTITSTVAGARRVHRAALASVDVCIIRSTRPVRSCDRSVS
jgi:hypothetical protein